MLLLPVFLVAVVALIIGAAAPVSWAFGGHHHDDNGEEIPFDEASIFFELNDTDGDLGIHALVDGDPWKSLKIEGPDERTLIWVSSWSKMRRHGLTELFFESAEYPFVSEDSEEVTLTPEQFFHRFPAGEYEIEGRTVEGEELESEVDVTHRMPAPAGNLRVNGTVATPAEEEDCDDLDLPTQSGDVTISWDLVTTSHPTIGTPNSGAIDIVRYEAVAEWEDEENVYVFSVVLQPHQRSITVPATFFEGAEEFKVEVLAREASGGNQTAVESCDLEYED